jgi:hypothetical protein
MITSLYQALTPEQGKSFAGPASERREIILILVA